MASLNSSRTYVPIAKRQDRQAGNTVKQRQRHERRQRMLSMRQAGASYSEIVRAGIGYSNVGQVSKDMKIVLQQFQYETPEDVLVLDLARLDEMQRILTVDMRAGDPKGTIPILLRVMQFRRETLGVTAENIAERQQSKTQVNNSGIMVVQGTTGDYVAAMAAAVGADPSLVRRELEAAGNSSGKNSGNSSGSNSGNDAAIADAEIVEGDSASSSAHASGKVSRTTGKSSQKSSVRKYRVVAAKNSTEDSAGDSADSSGSSLETPMDRRLLDFAERRDREDESRELMRSVSPSDRLLNIDVPADGDGIPDGVSGVPDISRNTFSVPVKDYDHNVPLSAVSYRTPPRKMSRGESRELIVRKLGKGTGKGGPDSDGDGFAGYTDVLETETVREVVI